MGSDFLDKRKESNNKSWDGEKEKFLQRDLLTLDPKLKGLTVPFAANSNEAIETGEIVLLRVEGGDVVAIKENRYVGRTTNAPRPLVDALTSLGGCALGEVRSHLLRSGALDIQLVGNSKNESR